MAKDKTMIMDTFTEYQHLVTMLDAATQYILNSDDCTKEKFMEQAGHAYDTKEQQIIIHVKALSANWKANEQH